MASPSAKRASNGVSIWVRQLRVAYLTFAEKPIRTTGRNARISEIAQSCAFAQRGAGTRRTRSPSDHHNPSSPAVTTTCLPCRIARRRAIMAGGSLRWHPRASAASFRFALITVAVAVLPPVPTAGRRRQDPRSEDTATSRLAKDDQTIFPRSSSVNSLLTVSPARRCFRMRETFPPVAA